VWPPKKNDSLELKQPTALTLRSSEADRKKKEGRAQYCICADGACHPARPAFLPSRFTLSMRPDGHIDRLIDPRRI
jgi:hypothetical protein